MLHRRRNTYTRSQVVAELSKTLDVMRAYENHVPPVPEPGVFYSTFNDSIVFVTGIDDDGEARAVILRGGCGNEVPGDSYWLSPEGYHRDDDPGLHLVLGLREKLDFQLPSTT